MKKLLFGSLITLMATAATPVVAAEITPMNLVYQGYQGRLSSEGIPGYANFLQKVYFGKIEAKDLVDGAIAQGKLDADLANDESYLDKVDSALFLLQTNGSAR